MSSYINLHTSHHSKFIICLPIVIILLSYAGFICAVAVDCEFCATLYASASLAENVIGICFSITSNYKLIWSVPSKIHNIPNNGWMSSTTSNRSITAKNAFKSLNNLHCDSGDLHHCCINCAMGSCLVWRNEIISEDIPANSAKPRQSL